MWSSVARVTGLVLSLCSACLFAHKEVGVIRSLLPTPLFEHMSMGQARPTDTLDHTVCAIRALMPTLVVQVPHVCHRQETGPSLWARTCSATRTFPRRLHTKAHRFLCLIPFTSEKPRSNRLAIISPVMTVFDTCFHSFFNAPRGARRCLHRMTLKFWFWRDLRINILAALVIVHCLITMRSVIR